MSTNLLTPILDEFEAESAALHARYRARIGERIAQARDVINAELAGVAATTAPRVYPRAKSKAKKLGRAR